MSWYRKAVWPWANWLDISSAYCKDHYAPINVNVKPAEGWGRWGIGWDFDRLLWPGGRGFELSCCPGGRDIFEFLLVPVTTNHFPGWGIQLYLTSHFCLGVGNLTAIFGKMSKSRPMLASPRRLDIDRCIKYRQTTQRRSEDRTPSSCLSIWWLVRGNLRKTTVDALQRK